MPSKRAAGHVQNLAGLEIVVEFSVAGVRLDGGPELFVGLGCALDDQLSGERINGAGVRSAGFEPGQVVAELLRDAWVDTGRAYHDLDVVGCDVGEHFDHLVQYAAVGCVNGDEDRPVSVVGHDPVDVVERVGVRAAVRHRR